MSKAKELLGLYESKRSAAEERFAKNLEDKAWVEAALKKMGKKWLFSGDVNAFEFGGTWWKFDGRGVDVVNISGMEDGPHEDKMSTQSAYYSVDDIMKRGKDVIGYVDATGGGNIDKPEDQISNVAYGIIHYFGGEYTDVEVDPEDDTSFWEYMKRAYGIKEQ